MNILPSPSGHAEMPKRMVGRTLVRTCSCGKPWPCEQPAAAQWTALRDEIQELRTTYYEVACDLADEGKPDERAFGRVDALDDVLLRMARMGDGR